MAQLANLTTTLALESASFVNGIEQSRGAVRNLIASLDPAAAAQAKFNRQMDLAERGLKTGQISADLYEKVVGRLKQRLDAVANSGGAVVASSGQMKAGFQQLGYQLGDISQGFAAGTSASVIFAQQSGQVIQALQLMSTETKGVLAFLGGPWGAVLGAALVAATPFVAKIFEGNDALGDQIDKLKKNAESAAVASAAQEAFRHTAEGAIDGVRKLTEELDRQNDALRTNAELKNIQAKNYLETLNEQRARIVAALDKATQQQAALSTPGASDARLAPARMDADGAVAALRKQLTDIDAGIAKAQVDLERTRVSLAAEQAATNSNAIQKITKDYDDQIDAIQLRATEAAKAGKKIAVETYREISDLQKKKQVAIEAQQAIEAAAKRDADGNSKLSITEAAAIVRSIGGVITSAVRTTADQKKIYDDMLSGKHIGPVAKPGTSAHERGQAIDVRAGPGISKASLEKAFADQAGAIVRVLYEPSQNIYHVAFGGAAKVAAKVAEDQAKALAANLSDLHSKFDPAAKAASDYAASLTKINAAQAAGQITPEKAKEYAEAAAKAFRDARAKIPLTPESFSALADTAGRDFQQARSKSEEQARKQAKQEAERVDQRATRILTDQQAALGYANDQLSITTLNNAQRDKELARLAAIQELQRDGIGLESDKGKQILLNADLIEVARQKQELFNNSLREAQQFGDQFLEDVLDPRNWDDWGAAGKRILQDIESEFIRLAVLNPLKNMLFGESNPTLSSVGGIFSKLLGGGSGGITPSSLGGFGIGQATTIPDVGSLLSGLPKFASGGSFMLGGRDGVDRNILSLNGSPIAAVSKGETATIGRGGAAGGNSYYFSGNLLTPEFWQQIHGDIAVGSSAVVNDNNRSQSRAASRRLR